MRIIRQTLLQTCVRVEQTELIVLNQLYSDNDVFHFVSH